MTRRQNQRLSSILSIINGTAEHSHHTVRTAWAEQDEEIDDFSESANYRAMFEKNLQDIYRLLELARSVNHKLGSEGDSSAAGIQRDEDHSASKQRRDVAESPETTRRGGYSASPLPASPNAAAAAAFEAQNPEKRALAGRKPMRAIMQELAKRLQILKTNPIEWEALQSKIAAYRQASQKRMLSNEMGAVRHNKKTAKTLVPEVRHEIIAKRKIRNQVHRDEVLSKKHEIDESVQTQKQEALRRKEEAAARNLVREKESGGKAQAVQTKWFIIVVVATRVQMAKSLLQEENARRLGNLQRYHAALVLQRSYRAWKEAKIQKLRRSALRIISRAFRRFYPKWRQNRIRKSANIIQSFFKEVYDVSKLLKIVKRYRLSVITAQRHSRAFLQIRNAQLNAMSLYWDKLEGLWWSQRNKTSQADLEDKKAKKKKKSKKDDAADKITVKIPEEIKQRVLLENLLARRKLHRKALEEASTAIAAYNEDIKVCARLKPDPCKSKLTRAIQKRLFLIKDQSEHASKAPKLPIFKARHIYACIALEASI
ncbi:hypothetical protein HK105_206119 [Polyrhizophydium stewartii]|uniref:Uncharacterized protein n=1 Tax=Polyrhizophydium stewartii TaxID=2732419 RepID=A0ABR4N480_9FUNG